MHHRRRSNEREQGVAMLIVMLVLLMITATAIFAIHATSFEVRAAGATRQAVATQYVGETGVIAAMDWMDRNGGQRFAFAKLQSYALRGGELDMSPYEPALATGKDAYRLGLSDFLVSTDVVDNTSLGNLGATYQPFILVDIYDDYQSPAAIAGYDAGGNSELVFLNATYTSRGRTRLPETAPGISSDFEGSLRGEDFHEAASDARALGRTGPFAPLQ